MALLSRQRGPIVLYGATGYTGKLVAAELASAKADLVLSGRSEPKLRALADELGGDIPVRAASLDDPEALRSVMAGCAAVISCAGPFTKYGEPVLRAAVESQAHFLDSTGEQAHMRMALDEYGPQAEAAGVAVIPAMGFDYVPGDMIAALTADGMGEVDEVALAYTVSGFGATRGTMRSTLEVLGGGDVEWRKLQWLPADQSIGRGHFDFPEPIGRRRMMRYPAGEQLTVPRHVPTRRVRTIIDSSMAGPEALGPLLPLMLRPAGLMMRTPAKRILDRMIDRLPEGQSPEDRAAVRFTIVCDVTRGGETRRGVISGSDVYGLTGASVARGAIIAAEGGVSGAGGLAPSQAFNPRRFLKDLGEFDVEWELEGSRTAPKGADERAAAPA